MPRHFEVNEDDPAARDFFVALNHVVFSKVLADACDCLLLEIQKWVGELEAEKKDVEAVLRTVNSEYFRAEGRFYRCRLKFRQKDYYCQLSGPAENLFVSTNGKVAIMASGIFLRDADAEDAARPRVASARAARGS
ncbi:unnamed protein product [Effrenium voratum]|nr:unnamed protein product [Effrenium voratum]